MRKNTQLIQREYYTDSESEYDYLLVVEDVPVASYTV